MTGVLYGLLPGAAVLLVTIILIGFGTPVPIAVGISAAARAVSTFCGPAWAIRSVGALAFRRTSVAAGARSSNRLQKLTNRSSGPPCA
jgi:hypothetical protein